MKEKLRWLIMFLAVCIFLGVQTKTQAADGQVRVLTITRGDYGGANNLTPGPQNDGKNFRRILKQAYGEAGIVKDVVKEKDGVTTVEGVKASIQDTFAEASSEDINYLYYSGHGSRNGLYLGGTAVMTADELAKSFEGIEGTSILVVDCCYSGGLASRSLTGGTSSESFVETFVNNFQSAVTVSGKTARSALTNSRFKLLMASSPEELSWQMNFGGNVLGGFTATLCYGAGVDPAKVSEETGYGLNVVSADLDRNGEVSLSEIHRYIDCLLYTSDAADEL